MGNRRSARRCRLGALLGAWLAVCVWQPPARAQSRPEFIAFQGVTKAALYRPDSGPAPRVGVLVMHRTSNYLGHRACTELSRRGFLMLCMNTRYENNEPAVDFEKLPLDVKAGVELLRRHPGIAKVVLFAHSGGGPLMSLYQAVAENGTSYCKGRNKITECEEDLAGLPRADGIVFADAHPGNAVNLLRGINPAFVNESHPPDQPLNPELDMLDPRNGFNPKGASHYPAEFQARYTKAQSNRLNRLIDAAQAKLARITRGDHRSGDSDLVIIPGGGNPGSGPGGSAALFIAQPDIPAVNSTARPAKLIQNDGSISTQVVTSVFVANPALARSNLQFTTGTKVYTLRSFLSANAVRSKDAYGDVDHCSSNNSTVCAVQSISVPVLFVAMGAHYFIRDNERHYEVARSEDKDFVVVEGATHGFAPCVECERTPGQYSNSVKNTFDYMATWMNERY
jgi:pimeloyl-ACP methyl ester carboxylesterase